MNKKNEILLVEDNPDDLQLMLRALQMARMDDNIHIARDGEEAIQYLFCEGEFANRTSEPPRLILLDLKLPKIDGLEILQKIREDSRTKMIPVVILTSSNDHNDILQSYQKGVNSYIVKPVNFVNFASTVETLGIYWLQMNRTTEF